MKVTILTLFPEMFSGPFDYSILKNARDKGLVEIVFVNIRDFGVGSHKMVDDKPYGGGVGMVMKVDVLHKAIEATKDPTLSKNEQKVVLMDADGETFHQGKARQFSKLKHLILLCGHYEGVDERIKKYIDEEISIGNFVVTGGEIPAMLITDAIVRLIPGVLREGVTDHESFSLGNEQNTQEATDNLEYPHYTRPPDYEGDVVPDVLLSGNHKDIEEWKKKQISKVKKLKQA